MAASSKYNYLAVCALVIISIVAVYKVVTAPDNTFNPLCTYTSQYSLEAKLKVGDEILSSTINRQRSISREWVNVINSAGCQQAYGRALSFRSSDNRVFLVSTKICPIAEVALLELGEADFLKLCDDKRAYVPQGFMITDAENPTWWQPFNPLAGDIGTLILMRATETDNHPSDELELVAPKILKTRFDTGGYWSRSPAAILRFNRGNTEGSNYKARKIQVLND